MRFLPAAFLGVVLLTSSVAIPVAVLAQATSPSPPSAATLFGGSDTELQQLQQEYRTHLITYREAERNFSLAKQQYAQLTTLAALEEAVRKTREVLLARNDVLEVHLQILKLHLQRTPGIDLQTKASFLARIDAYIDAVRKNQLTVETSDDRAKILNATLEFGQATSGIQQLSTQLTSLIQYGKIQSVSDKATAIRAEIEIEIETEPNALKLGEKRRAMTEIHSLMQQTDQLLTTIRESYNPKQDPQSSGNQASAEALNQVYGNLAKTITYLKEVLE